MLRKLLHVFFCIFVLLIGACPSYALAAAEFSVTTTSNTKTFSFYISAAGSYTIDWGDGKGQTVTKRDVGRTEYNHTYTNVGQYTIGISGDATAYADSLTPAIDFSYNDYVSGISGSLGAVFSTLPNGSQPSFYYTFSECPNLRGSIPSGLFQGVSGTPTESMFAGTFDGAAGLTGTIPSNLFSGISGAPAADLFAYTFSGCSGLTGRIPDGLFSGISGAPATGMFNSTFSGCVSLSGSIPEGLFAGISGTPAANMYSSTFKNCSGLTGSIPSELFAGIEGEPAAGMYSSTFYGCSGLSGTIPENLFGNISGYGSFSMYSYTFYGCTGLTGEIPLGLFGDLSDSAATSMFYGTFNGCSGLTGPSARMPNGQYLYDVYGRTSSYGSGMYTGATGLSDYSYIPTQWGGLGKAAPEFMITTIPDISSFSFYISAAGNYTIDWGDGEVQTVNKTDTLNTYYSHSYDTAGQYTIGISGDATSYNFSSKIAAISFLHGIEEISGSLGAVFGTLASGVQPSFYRTFYNCSSMQGEIPSGLFDGISGKPKGYMFAETFYNCMGLTGSIPEDLFAGISGAPAIYMFEKTFGNCQRLTGSIPPDLFAGISGTPAESMFMDTFAGCSGLTGSIPEGLFAGISGAPATHMFTRTFSDCSGLTGTIPDGLFAGISGAPATYMYNGVFSGCSGLTGVIPDGLFGNISGAPASNMFEGTFEDCNGLTGEIPLGLFGNLTSTPANAMFYRTFYNCDGLTGPSARMPNGQYLYDVYGRTSSYGTGMYMNATGLSDYDYIPTQWGGLGYRTCTVEESNEFCGASSDTDSANGFGCYVSDATSEHTCQCNSDEMTFYYGAGCYCDSGYFNDPASSEVNTCQVCPDSYPLSDGYDASQVVGSSAGNVGAMENVCYKEQTVQETNVMLSLNVSMAGNSVISGAVCDAGYWLQTPLDGEIYSPSDRDYACDEVGTNYYSADNNSRVQCPTYNLNGQNVVGRTAGYGDGADSIADCKITEEDSFSDDTGVWIYPGGCLYLE